jgi:hypothetical protein
MAVCRFRDEKILAAPGGSGIVSQMTGRFARFYNDN